MKYIGIATDPKTGSEYRTRAKGSIEDAYEAVCRLYKRHVKHTNGIISVKSLTGKAR